MGQFASMCLVQGGAAIRLFSSSVYAFLFGKKPSDIIVDISEVSQVQIREFVEQVYTVSVYTFICLVSPDTLYMCDIIHTFLSDNEVSI